jgi:hypothetical protein
MLFGRQPSKAEEVGLRQLNKRLDELFEGKLKKFSSRASSIAKAIYETRQQFSAACDEFDSVASAPDTEYIGGGNANQVRSQKGSYVTALHRIIEYATPVEHPTSYSRCSAELSSLEAMIGEVLKTNNRFKMVMLAYSKHLGNFKRVFSALESLAATLKRELESVSNEYAEYDDVKGHIINIETTLDEMAATKGELDSLQQATGHATKETVREGIAVLNEKLEARRKDRDNAIKEIEEVSFRMFSVLTPLKRTARLYDHLSKRKTKLSDIVSDPKEFFLQKDRFAEFSSMLDELARKIESSDVKVKDVKEAMEEINRARSANLFEDASLIRVLDERRRAAEDEMHYLEKLVADIKSEDTKKETHGKAVADMKGKLADLDTSVQKEKAEIERFLLSYYKARITILLNA